jgi:hypothetical protein
VAAKHGISVITATPDLKREAGVFTLSTVAVEEGFPGIPEEGGKFAPGVGRAHINNAAAFDSSFSELADHSSPSG